MHCGQIRLPLIGPLADTLPKAFRDAHFAFHGTALKGTTEPKPRWQQGIDQMNAAMGEALGREYVAKYFPPERKAQVQVWKVRAKHARARLAAKRG